MPSQGTNRGTPKRVQNRCACVAWSRPAATHSLQPKLAKGSASAGGSANTDDAPAAAPHLEMASDPDAPSPDARTRDAALVEDALEGRRNAQEALFRRHLEGMHAFAFRILASEADAEDVVQDAFVAAFARLRQLDDPRRFGAWLRSIVLRRSYNHLRKRRLLNRLGLRRGEPIDMDRVIAPTASPDVAATLEELYRDLDQLPVQERIALVLHRVEGSSHAEIAEELGVSVATVKRRIADAEARLKRD